MLSVVLAQLMCSCLLEHGGQFVKHRLAIDVRRLVALQILPHNKLPLGILGGQANVPVVMVGLTAMWAVVHCAPSKCTFCEQIARVILITVLHPMSVVATELAPQMFWSHTDIPVVDGLDEWWWIQQILRVPGCHEIFFR